MSAWEALWLAWIAVTAYVTAVRLTRNMLTDGPFFDFLLASVVLIVLVAGFIAQVTR